MAFKPCWNCDRICPMPIVEMQESRYGTHEEIGEHRSEELYKIQGV